MPYRDPEKQKEAQRNQMRQRRAGAKSKQAGVTSSPAVGATSSPTETIPTGSQGTATLELHSPPPRPAAHKPNKVPIDIYAPGAMWEFYEGKEGRPCFNNPFGRCCMDMRFPVTWKRFYCGFDWKGCNYFKGAENGFKQLVLAESYIST